jgi:hypothetical protein
MRERASAQRGEPAGSPWRAAPARRDTQARLRAGVVGVGRQALEDHIPGLAASDCAQLVAICDENPEVVREQQDRQRVPGYTDFHEMFQAEQLNFGSCSSGAQSGSRSALLRPGPLRTGRAGFPRTTAQAGLKAALVLE